MFWFEIVVIVALPDRILQIEGTCASNCAGALRRQRRATMA